MAKPFSLQTVLDLMQIRTDEATQALARLVSSERDAKTKLELLQQYHDEYSARFRQAANTGLSQSEWRNYQEFLSRIDAAITSQHETVAQQAKNTEEGQIHWQQQRRKLKAFDTLSDRHQAKEQAIEVRREQKTQDEFAARHITHKDNE